jgi:hypothetical protein
LRVSDVLEYSPTRNAFIQSIGTHNVATLEEMNNLHLYDFGIFIELAPDEEEKQMLENNIQMAIQQQSIDLEDAIDLRDVKNIKLANQLLKIRRKKKQARDMQMQQQNIQSQAQANAQTQQVAAQAEIEKQQAITSQKMELMKMEADFETRKLQQEALLKKELMNHEFKINQELKKMDLQSIESKDKYKEDRKDDRTKIQASQQSELIDQRNNKKPPKNFESSSNDILGGGFGLNSFDPR